MKYLNVSYNKIIWDQDKNSYEILLGNIKKLDHKFRIRKAVRHLNDSIQFRSCRHDVDCKKFNKIIQKFWLKKKKYI